MTAVSIIIPVYNVEKYLEKCLDSVCNQTLKDIEIICINDCSPDNSLEILNRYAKNDSRVKVINFEENKGVSAARNRGIDEAQGEYIGFVDSDDYVDLDFYEKLYNKAKETDSDVAKGELLEINNNENISEMIINYDLNGLINLNKAYFYYTFTTAIYRKELILNNSINFPNGLNYFEDSSFTIKSMFYCNEIKTVDNAKYYYYTNKPNRENKYANIESIGFLHKGSLNILNMLNNISLSKEHYQIVFDFVFRQVLEWCNNKNLSDECYIELTQIMNDIYSKCKYKKEILGFYNKNLVKVESIFYKRATFRNLRKLHLGKKC